MIRLNNSRQAQATRSAGSDAMQPPLEPAGQPGLEVKKGMHAMNIFGLVLFGLLIFGCASQLPSTRPVDLSVEVIYRISEQDALDLAYSAIDATLPGTKIYKTKESRRGYYTLEEVEEGDVRYARFKAKTYIHMVHVLPAQGKDESGATVSGYYFNISGSGDLESGPAQSAQLKAHLQEAFGKTGQGVAVSDVTGGQYETKSGKPQKTVLIKKEKTPSDDVFEQLKKLKELRDQEVITDEEFRSKKRELLDRI